MLNIKEIFISAKKLNKATDDTGFKSKLLAYSYLMAFNLILIMVIYSMVYFILGGVYESFKSNLALIKDFDIAMIAGVTGIITAIATTCMGASISENKADKGASDA